MKHFNHVVKIILILSAIGTFIFEALVILCYKKNINNHTIITIYKGLISFGILFSGASIVYVYLFYKKKD